MFMCDFRYLSYVSNGKQRVCRALDKYRLHVFREHLLHRIRIRCIRNLILNPEMSEDFVKDTIRPAVYVARDQDPVSLREKRQYRGNRREPCAECRAVAASLELCNQRLEGSAGRVPGSGIFPAPVPSQTLLLVCRSLIDRSVHRARKGVSVYAAVYHGSFKIAAHIYTPDFLLDCC